jgi:hypothetical protein
MDRGTGNRGVRSARHGREECRLLREAAFVPGAGRGKDERGMEVTFQA